MTKSKIIIASIIEYENGNPLDPNLRDREGRTPFHFACKRGNVNGITALNSYGEILKIEPRDLGGETPLFNAI